MSQISSQLRLPTPENVYETDFQKILRIHVQEVADILNGGILLTADNLNANLVTYTSNAVADTEDTVAHTLKRVPNGYIVYCLDKASIVYKSATAWTVDNIYLKCNVASTEIKIIIF